MNAQTTYENSTEIKPTERVKIQPIPVFIYVTPKKEHDNKPNYQNQENTPLNPLGEWGVLYQEINGDRVYQVPKIRSTIPSKKGFTLGPTALLLDNLERQVAKVNEEFPYVHQHIDDKYVTVTYSKNSNTVKDVARKIIEFNTAFSKYCRN